MLFCVAVVPNDVPGVVSCCVLLCYGVFCVAVAPGDVPGVPSLGAFCYIMVCCFVLL